MPNTNRDQLIKYINEKIDACLAKSPAVFPAVNSWLVATPGIMHDNTIGAPPVFIGWLNQILQDSTKATSEPVAQTLGTNINTLVKAAGDGSSSVVGVGLVGSVSGIAGPGPNPSA